MASRHSLSFCGHKVEYWSKASVKTRQRRLISPAPQDRDSIHGTPPWGLAREGFAIPSRCTRDQKQQTALRRFEGTPPCRVLPSFAPALAGGGRPGRFSLGSGLSLRRPRDWPHI